MFEELFEQKGLSLDRLKTLCLVAEAGGIARAARGEVARQSLYSRQIRELEEFFGVELTRRRGKGIVMTEAGRDLVARVRGQLLSLSDYKRENAGRAVEFNIVSGNSALEWLLIPHFGEVGSKVGGASFCFRDMGSGEALRALADHRVDFGLMRGSVVSAPLKFHSLGWVDFRLYAPGRWVRKGTQARGLVMSRPVALTLGGEFCEEFHAMCERTKVQPEVRFTCASFTQCLELVRAGQAVAPLPRFVENVLGHGAVRGVDFPEMRSYRREMGIAWHPRLMTIRPQAAEVLERLKTLGGKVGGGAER